ncbi:ROK family protein [Draconibacterium halophilum]|uniref:ROK family protein n=1 Tax=Draconibacterium halophilum TaxID=2706887 RepID=A0A6C0RBZ3_9BACT|nr:ROK family protein [Draconibacterium halophilum]QIA07422.1 ROK family protein [Draconibacterium halophilum]
MNEKYAIGVDVGGSHISSVVVDASSGNMLKDSLDEVKVDNQATADEILDKWVAAISESIKSIERDKLIGIGFAMPGPFDYKNGVALLKNVAKYDSLYGMNIGDELKKRLELPDEMPFRYSNDALSFAIGECWGGKASNYKNVVAITLGTGFGSAFLTNGVPVIEGERVPEKGYVYNIPYKNGIADDHFSTRWFVNEYQRRTGINCAGVKEITDCANEDEDAKLLFEDFGHNLAIFLLPLLTTFDAECLVVGGNISGAYSLFGNAFQDVLEKEKLNIDVVISELMESAAMVGSARLLDKDFWTKMEPLVAKI